MADKQFARSGPAEFEPLADDDPLSELARIVGYDARPAVQQLQELQRHQEAMRREPAFDLEEELLRAFDSYDTPHAAPVRPDSGLVEHPSAPVSTDGPHSVFDEQVAQNAVVTDVAPALEGVAEAAASPSIETPVERTSNEDLAAVAVAPHDEPAVDLERELELSLGYDASPDATDAAQPDVVPAGVSDVPVFSDWQEPLSAKLAVAGKLAEQAGLAEPVYVDMAGDLAGAAESNELEDIAVAPPEMPSQPSASTDADRLLTDVERFPVPAAAEVAAPAVAETQDRSAPAAVKKNNYPFTPTFSRATPVASSGGVSQQRAFATPTVETAVASPAATSPAAASPAVVVQSVSPERAPEMRAEAAPQVPENRMPEAEIEPSFDIEDFELELADIALDLDLTDSPVADAPASIVATQAAVAHPALVETPAQPYLQAMGAPREPETFVHQASVSSRDMPVPVEPEKPTADVALPFDPAMIGETESGVAPIGELDVPQLPPVEAEEKAAAYPADYDLDIDAEMAQLFSAPAPAAKNGANLEPVAASADKADPVFAPADDFDEFEKAMEEDFQRSMAERRSPTQEAERMTAMPHAQAEEYREDGYGRRSQRSMLLAASVAGIIIVGGAAVYAWMGGSNAVLSGDGPKIILADKTPVKVVPEEKGGKTVPNQDKAVYDRVAGVSGKAPLQQSLVSSTEEPMDVVQRTLTPETLPLEGRGDVETLPGASPADDDEVARLLPGTDAGNAADEEEAVPAVAPRKVRTMIVKPDGTLVPREEPAPQQESAAATAGGPAPIPARASGEAVAAGSQAEATAAAQPDQLAAASEGATPVRSVKTTALPQARPAAQPQAAAPAAAPAESQPATETAAAPLATASVPAGSYVIQIASLPSEAEAQKSYNNLSSKYASVIGGRGVDIRKAEIAGKGTYYRVRIPVGSREEANSLCSRYKSAGGSCLVTK
ncbi:SPOR domain-containing protein [Sinorhizobium meliloti]|jgi:hypothetical protein|uniref:SPOR domain-containing protein n=1 Tax=Rhizobium meliloti TaxID=382 RepID=UPI00037B42F2|nr:SPOR domain-containing protein [Sinorhizobium meliloti]PND19653.1 SPOR domain-containing protein [Ensifer sp. MMN_5]